MKKHKPGKKKSHLSMGTALLGTTLCLLATGNAHAQTAAEPPASTKPATDEVVTLDALNVEENNDPNFVLPNQPLQGTFGFSKPLVETPRSVSVIGSDLVDRIGIRDGDQLSRIIPGTYTVNRWGIAGSTQVRGLPADTYLRGMKRIDSQGNIRNVITMWDNVEIVRGPPSPIYGNGRIGGYVNYTPKSVRGTTGKYLEKPTGSVSGVVASWDRLEGQLNYSVPFKVGGRDGGVQAFALANDANSYYQDNFQVDRVVQVSSALDLNDRWRMEVGQIYQRAINAGQAGANRVSQQTLDNGLYLRGSALVNLDTNGDGRVSEAEIQASRSIAGTGGTFRGSRPLSIAFGNITGVLGNDTLIGAPQTYINLLNSWAATGTAQQQTIANSTQGQAIRNAGPIRLASGVTGNADTTTLINNLNNVPAGYFLNPTEVRYEPRDWSLVAIEEKADGFTHTAYLDFLDDKSSAATQKFQLFYDFQDQKKQSQLPFNQKQKIAVFEGKYTVTRDADTLPLLDKLPDFMDLKLLGSINSRRTDANRRSTSGDYDHRRDLVTGYTPSDTFASYVKTGDESFLTGEPVSADITSGYWESGIGTLSELDLWERLNVLGGFRYDYISADTFEDNFYSRSGSSASPISAAEFNRRTNGLFDPTSRRSAKNDDDGKSWNYSISYKTPWYGLIPYYTRASSSSALTGTFQEIAYSNVRNRAIISAATLEEWGLKGKILNDKFQYAFSRFSQIRTGNVIQEGESYNRSNRNEGYELELRYVPNRNWSFIGSVARLEITRVKLNPTQVRTAQVDADFLGISDIVDSAGNVIPANSFLYGGNTLVNISNADSRFNEFGQYPEYVYGLFVGYNWDNNWSVSWSGNWVNAVGASSEILYQLKLPGYTTHNFTVAWDDKKTWRVAFQVRNAFDEEFWVPNNGSAGGTLLQPGLPRNYELTLTRRF